MPSARSWAAAARADGTVQQGRGYGSSITEQITPAGQLSPSSAKQDAVQGQPSMIWLGALGWILHYHCQISIIYQQCGLFLPLLPYRYVLVERHCYNENGPEGAKKHPFRTGPFLDYQNTRPATPHIQLLYPRLPSSYPTQSDIIFSATVRLPHTVSYYILGFRPAILAVSFQTSAFVQLPTQFTIIISAFFQLPTQLAIILPATAQCTHYFDYLSFTF